MPSRVPERPDILRVMVFVDGQNFFKDCESVFGRGETYPHLSGKEICHARFGQNRVLERVRFYTGIHDPRRNPQMHAYMSRRLHMMDKTGVWTFSRPLKYSKQWVKNRYEDPEFIEIWRGREKGVDVKLALDLLLLAAEDAYDVAVIVSTDTDLDEAVKELYRFRDRTGKWLAVENAICVRPINPVTGMRPPFKRLRSVKRLLFIDEEIFERIRDDTDYLP